MNLKDNAKNILTSCMAVQAGEELLVVTDDSRTVIGQAFYEAAKNLGCEAILLTMKEQEVSGQEPPRIVADAMKSADVVICPTAQSLTHTNAKIEAAKTGTRIATMPGITLEMFSKGAITADYDQVEKLTEKMTALLTKASAAVIEKDGCILTIDLTGRNGVPSSGVYRHPGESGNLPSGEAYIAPLENGSNGEMIIDGSMVGIGKLNAPLHVTVKDGKLCSIKGAESKRLSILLENEANATLGELGIGTNKAAILSGVILEDEKVYGTVHIAFGTNTSFGGVNKAECHMDGIILNPTLYLDGEKVIDKGEFLVES
ncbi:MAG: aminopeptidase [Oscillospiraceae bacterium]|nr:aminopeptidase [Oscillospiraceae bacterium]